MNQKPITLLAEDFQRNLVSLINSSGLPYFAIRGILKDCIEEITIAGQKQLAIDRQNYEDYIRQNTRGCNESQDNAQDNVE